MRFYEQDDFFTSVRVFVCQEAGICPYYEHVVDKSVGANVMIADSHL